MDAISLLVPVADDIYGLYRRTQAGRWTKAAVLVPASALTVAWLDGTAQG